MVHRYITAHEQTQQNRVCYFRFFDVFLASRGSLFRTYFINIFIGFKVTNQSRAQLTQGYNSVKM